MTVYTPNSLWTCVGVYTYVCGLRHPTANLQQRFFSNLSNISSTSKFTRSPDFSLPERKKNCVFANWMSGVTNQSQAHVKNKTQVTWREKISVANQPSGVVSRIHVYIHFEYLG